MGFRASFICLHTWYFSIRSISLLGIHCLVRFLNLRYCCTFHVVVTVASCLITYLILIFLSWTRCQLVIFLSCDLCRSMKLFDSSTHSHYLFDILFHLISICWSLAHLLLVLSFLIICALSFVMDSRVRHFQDLTQLNFESYSFFSLFYYKLLEKVCSSFLISSSHFLLVCRWQ
jgi:hypothetical protein